MHLRRKNQCNKIKYRLEAGPLGPEAWDLSSSKFSWSPLSALRSRHLYFLRFWSSTRFSPRRTASRWTAPYRRCSMACSSRLASERNEGMDERRRKNRSSLAFKTIQTLQATRWGQSLPKPNGGDIFLRRVTTSRCLIRPLASGSYSDHRRMNSSKWWGPSMDQSLVK